MHGRSVLPCTQPPPEPTTVIIQRCWGGLRLFGPSLDATLTRLAQLAAEGWQEATGGELPVLHELSARILSPRNRVSETKRPKNTGVLITFRGKLTPPVSMRAGWGTDGTIALSPTPLSFDRRRNARGTTELSAPGFVVREGALVRAEDAGPAPRRGDPARRSAGAPSRSRPTPTLDEFRSRYLARLEPGPDRGTG